MASILQKEQKSLREISAPIPVKDIGGKRLLNIISSMKRALLEQPDGVAIAAPQIGENIRLFIVSKRAFAIEREMEGLAIETESETEKDLVCINPVLVRASRQKEWMEEGCLSVRWLYGKVNRSIKAKIRALDENGMPFERGGSGIIAQIFQHELDHLDGTLFIDKAKDVHEMRPESEDLKPRQWKKE